MSRPSLGGRRFGPVIARGRGAVTEWGPLDEADLELMLKGTLGVTLVSGKVSVWADQSPNGRDVSQAVASLRPVMGASGGKDAVVFSSAVATSLKAAFGVLADPITVYIVMEAATLPTLPTVFDNNNSSRSCRIQNVSGAWRLLGSSSLSGGGSTADRAVCVTSDAVEQIFNGDDFTTPDGTGAVGVTGLSGVTIGNWYGTTAAGSWDGAISEVLVFGSVHDAAKRAQVGGYFNAEYGLGITV